jgi:hypothetical protein
MEQKKSPKKPKNEIEEMNKTFDLIVEKYEKERLTVPDYTEIYLNNEIIKHFNKRIIECNKVCIKYPEINELLYEEETCLNNCQRKIKEVQNVVKSLMNELNIKNSKSDYLL